MARRPDAVDLQSQGSVTPDDRRVCPAEDDLLAWVHRWHARVCSLLVWLLAAGGGPQADLSGRGAQLSR
jgi:hypothetical protein